MVVLRWQVSVRSQVAVLSDRAGIVSGFGTALSSSLPRPLLSCHVLEDRGRGADTSMLDCSPFRQQFRHNWTRQ